MHLTLLGHLSPASAQILSIGHGLRCSTLLPSRVRSSLRSSLDLVKVIWDFRGGPGAMTCNGVCILLLCGMVTRALSPALPCSETRQIRTDDHSSCPQRAHLSHMGALTRARGEKTHGMPPVPKYLRRFLRKRSRCLALPTSTRPVVRCRARPRSRRGHRSLVCALPSR